MNPMNSDKNSSKVAYSTHRRSSADIDNIRWLEVVDKCHHISLAHVKIYLQITKKYLFLSRGRDVCSVTSINTRITRFSCFSMINWCQTSFFYLNNIYIFLIRMASIIDKLEFCATTDLKHKQHRCNKKYRTVLMAVYMYTWPH